MQSVTYTVTRLKVEIKWIKKVEKKIDSNASDRCAIHGLLHVVGVRAVLLSSEDSCA